MLYHHTLVLLVFFVIFFACMWSLTFSNITFPLSKDSKEYLNLKKEGLTDDIISHLSCSKEGWYFYNKRLCVGCGEGCNPLVNVCVKEETLPKAIKEALYYGEHPSCPLIY